MAEAVRELRDGRPGRVGLRPCVAVSGASAAANVDDDALAQLDDMAVPGWLRMAQNL